MSIRRIRCIVIRIPEDQPAAAELDIQQFQEIELPASPRRDVVPWADPYIMRLIDRCQQEARQEMGLPAKSDPRQSRLGLDDADPVESAGWAPGDLPATAPRAARPRRPR